MSLWAGRKEKTTLKCHVNRSEALRYLGYSGQAVEGELMERFEALAARCEEELKARYVWCVYAIDDERTCWPGEIAHTPSAAHTSSAAGTPNVAHTPHVALEKSALELRGCDIGSLLAGCDRVVLMACTLGLESERALRQLAATSALDALMYGACASSLVEAGVDAAQAHVEQCAREEGCALTPMRFSPGYGDLPLSTQKPFLAATDATRALGISVSENYLLIPTKSVTAILGVFPNTASARAASAHENAPACMYDSAPGAGTAPDTSGTLNAPNAPDAPNTPAADAQSAPSASDASHGARDTSDAPAACAVDPLCARCRLLDHCSFRERGTTCHG